MPTRICSLDVAVATRVSAFLDVQAAVPVAIAARVDMLVADGGAASQLFCLDTKVSTPLVVGNHTAAFTVGVEFSVGNLDADVIDLRPGPSSIGVIALRSFVNNGDGTGVFLADFDQLVASRHLALIATDDVGNESHESPVFVVNDLAQSKYGEALSLRPQESVSTATCKRLLDAIPRTDFILKRQYTVPYSFNQTIFELRAVTPNEPVTIAVVRRGMPGDPSETQQYTVIPTQEVTLVGLNLGRGVNVVSVIDSFMRSDTIMVAATTYAAVMCSYAREIYNHSQVKIEEQRNAIFSPVSTRLAEPLLSFIDLLPDVKSQQTLATKLAIRSLVNGAGRHSGVQDMLSALTLSTPIFIPEKSEDTFFEPAVYPLFNVREAFAGVDAHVWVANGCVQRWLAFINFINSSDKFQVIAIREHEVIFKDTNGEVQRAVFDFSSDECSLTSLALQSTCFKNIDVSVSIFSRQHISVCAAAYPFDLHPTEDFPMRPVGDEIDLDPGFDGYIDFSVVGHWDGRDQRLDSQGAVPAVDQGESLCVYPDGYLVRVLLLASQNVSIDNFVSVLIGGTSHGSQRGTALDVSVIDTAPFRSTDMDMFIGTRTALVGLDTNIVSTPQLVIDLDAAISA